MGQRISVSLPSEHDGNGRRGPASRLHGDCAAVRSGCRPRPWVTAPRVPCRRSVHSPERTIGCRRARKVWLFGHLIMSIWRIPADHVTNRDGGGRRLAWVHGRMSRVRSRRLPDAKVRRGAGRRLGFDAGFLCSEYRAAWLREFAVVDPALSMDAHRHTSPVDEPARGGRPGAIWTARDCFLAVNRAKAALSGHRRGLEPGSILQTAVMRHGVQSKGA